jgi:2-C-methyl-D-erythritol 4-phosphate cytidylyltransferase/2-C-methyl-D-erythritol 2,4-cyclodiphosphate synthase
MALPPLHLIVLAGGRGLRAGGDVPKQFRSAGGGLLLGVSIRTFLGAEAGDAAPVSVTVTVDPAWRDAVRADLAPLGLDWIAADPGDHRTASTWNALEALRRAAAPAPGDLVAVHDAARPFAGADLLRRLAEAAAREGGAVPGVPVADTVVQRDGETARYLDRSLLLGVQTPQVFRWDLLHAAHGWAAATGADFTDDGGLLAARGHDPAVVPGEPGNWKVTTEDDWRRARERLGG